MVVWTRRRCAQMVGQMVQEMDTTETPPICLGIVPWGAVYNQEQMVSEGKGKVYRYESSATPPGSAAAVAAARHLAPVGRALCDHEGRSSYERGDLEYQYLGRDDKQPYEPAALAAAHKLDKSTRAKLDPNHSHFLMVDNGSVGQNAFGSEIQMRNDIESLICASTDLDQDGKVADRTTERTKTHRGGEGGCLAPPQPCCTGRLSCHSPMYRGRPCRMSQPSAPVPTAPTLPTCPPYWHPCPLLRRSPLAPPIGARAWQRDDKLPTPMVLLVVGGGLGTLDTIIATLKSERVREPAPPTLGTRMHVAAL